MIRPVLILLLICACINLQAQVDIITTIGGNGIGVYGDNVHDGGPATNAEIRWPAALCLDNANNIYIAEAGNNRIRKISFSTGIITTLGGTGAHGFSGDNGPATDAQFLCPDAVFIDTIGNVYVADGGNHRIRKISQITGIITTVAGSGPAGLGLGSDGGDGGPATDAKINGPTGLCLDKYGNIFIADWGNNKIKRVEAATGIISTVAGNGSAIYSGDGIQATNAGISGAYQVFVDNSGNIFICDQWNHAVRKVSATTGIITTVAGTGPAGYTGDNGLATNAQLNQPSGIFVDKQENIFIAEYGNGVIRKVDGATGIITTVAGIGTLGYSGDCGPATNAQLNCVDVFLNDYGTLFIADSYNDRIRMVRDTTLKVGIASPQPSPQVEREVLSLFPNPVHDELTIEGAEGSEVKIFNLLGQEVNSFGNLRMIKEKETINISTLPNGVYMVQMVASLNGLRTTRRFVKE